jgi:hypothetical protein
MQISNSHIRMGQESHDSSHTLQQHVWSCSTSCLHTILMTGRYSFCILCLCPQWLFRIAETLQKLGDCQALNPYQQVFSWILKESGLGSCVCVCVFFWGGGLRLSARQALRHGYFKDLRDKEKLQQAFVSANRSHGVRPSPGFIPPPPAPLLQNCYCLASSSLN